MKAFLIPALSLALSFTALAGPFRTTIVNGTVGPTDFVLQVPAGRAIGIVNFIADDTSLLSVTINNVTTIAMKPVSTANAVTAPSKEVVIAGPANITVDVTGGVRAFLTYRVFAN